jgi:hypothetical protein
MQNKMTAQDMKMEITGNFGFSYQTRKNGEVVILRLGPSWRVKSRGFGKKRSVMRVKLRMRGVACSA